MVRRWTLLAILMVALAAFWGCSDDNESVTGPTTTPFEAMVAAAGPLISDNTQTPGIVSAQALNDNLTDYTVIDIRSQADYDAGHIAGAYHSTLATLVSDLATTIPSGKPYVVACYTGQSAGHAKIAMELLGYSDVYSLGFGMSSWNTSVDRWTANCAQNLGNPETTDNNGNLSDHGYPTLAGNAKTIVRDRVTWMLQNGFQGKSYSDIRDNLGDYFVVNYFGKDDYMGTGSSGTPGHIPGAFQFTPYTSLGDAQGLKNLPADKPIVVYCWTGQTSSQVTAYLNMLGYEAYSLKFGSNNLFHDDLTAHKWTATAQNNFPLVPTTP